MDNENVPDPPLLSQTFDNNLHVYKSKPNDQFEPVRLHFLINARDDIGAQKFIESHSAKSLNHNVYGMTPLMIALARQNLFVSKLLVMHGCDISSSFGDKLRKQPIHMAAQLGDAELLRLMLERDAGLLQVEDNLKFTPLHHAAAKGNLENVEALISLGAHINAKDHRGMTSLHRACEENYTQVVETLVKAGATINAPDLAGWTPAFTSVVGRCYETLELLLSLEASVPVVDFRGRTLLHAACMCTDHHNIHILTLNNQDPIMQKFKSSTHIIRRLISGNSSEDSFAILQLLLNHPHTQLDVRDLFDKTALYYAIKDTLFKSAFLLLKEGATPLIQNMQQLLQTIIDADHAQQQNINTHLLQEQSNYLEPCQNYEVLTLGQICRKAIRKCCNWNIDKNIDLLPVPPFLKLYLKLS